MGADAHPPHREPDDAEPRLLLKLNGEWDFLSMLHAEGRRCAADFLEAHANDIGRRSTLDLDGLLDDAPEANAQPVRLRHAASGGRGSKRGKSAFG